MRAARRTSSRAAFAASVAVVALISACLPSAAGAAERRVPPGFFGVMWDKEIQDAPADLQAAEWQKMARSGVESARVIFSWNLAQERPEDKPNFVRADEMVRNAATHGIDLLPVITYAPDWARVEPGNLASAPKDLPAYGHYVSELVRRYGPRGYYWRRNPDVPKRPIRTWQIWNEPALEWQFSPHRGWPSRYAQILRTGARAVRRRDRRATIVLSGFANNAWTAIAQLYAAGNVRPYFDAAAVHMYSANPGDFVEIARRFRRAMDRAGDRRKPIFVTEAGASASASVFRSPGHEYFQTTNNGLARHIGASYRALTGVRGRLGIRHVYWYTWASSYDATSGVFGFAGLNAFSAFHVKPMPAMAAYRRTARAYEGCRKDASARCVR
jgi:hypothetical protein